VVGAGPTGVSAAWPIVEAGISVLLVDGGEAWRLPSGERPPLAEARGRSDAARWFVGPQGRSLTATAGTSPKLRTSMPHGAIETYLAANRIEASNFTPIGVLAHGGLSNIWGAGASAFDSTDLTGWPLAVGDLLPSYQRIAQRIGLSGSADDDMAGVHGTGWPVAPAIALGDGIENLLSRYAARRQRGMPFSLGRTRLAVLSHEHDGRNACTRDNFCMWQCRRGAIYNAADELDRLRAHANVRIVPRTVVQRIRPHGALWQVEANDAHGQHIVLVARRLVLAAGVLPTTRLVLDAVSECGTQRRLLTTPATTLVSVDLRRIGSVPQDRGLALGNVAFAVPGSDGLDAFGTIFPLSGVAAGDLAAAMPLSTRTALGLVRDLGSAMLATLVFLPGAFSRHVVTLKRDRDGRGILNVSGSWSTDLNEALRDRVRKIKKGLLMLGCVPLPRPIRPHPAGSESHYAGTLPMGELTSSIGEVRGAPGLYIADASTFPTLSAKSHTFTAMANADRIGSAIVSTLRD